MTNVIGVAWTLLILLQSDRQHLIALYYSLGLHAFTGTSDGQVVNTWQPIDADRCE